MAYDFKIEDIIDPKAIEEVKKLGAAFNSAATDYENMAKILAQGIKIKPVDINGLNDKFDAQQKAINNLASAQNELAKTQGKYLEVLSRIDKQISAGVNAYLNEKKAIDGNTSSVEKNTQAKQKGVSAVDASVKSTKSEETAIQSLNNAKKASAELDADVAALVEQTLNTRSGNIRILAEEESILKELAAAKKDVDDQEKKNLISAGEAISKRRELISEETTHKQIKAETQQILKNEEKLNQAAAGSYQEMSLTLERLRMAYRKLNEQEVSSEAGQGLATQINDLDKALKQMDSGIGNYQRNVGNYEIAGRSLRSELRELTEQLAAMKLAGQENTPEFQDLVNKAGQLRDAMSDVNQQVGVYASDTSKLDSAKQGVDALVQSYMMWKMASQSLGIENKELDEVMRTVMGTMALLNAATVVSNALQSQSALVKGISAVKGWILNTSLVAQAAATSSVAVATGTATAAQIALNAAIYASPIGWLLAIIGAVVGAFYGLYKVAKLFFADSEQRKAALEAEGKALENLTAQNDKHIRSLERRGKTEAEVMRASIALAEQMELRYKAYYAAMVKEYGKDSDEAKKALEEKQKATEKYNDTLQESADHFRKMISQAKDDKMAGTMDKVAFATKKANDEYKEMTALLYVLKRNGALTAEEFAAAVEAASIQMFRKIGDAEKEAAEQAKAVRQKELQYIRQAQDKADEFIAESYDKQQKMTVKKYDREIQDLRIKLREETGLTAKARKAINDTILSLEAKKVSDLKKLSDEEKRTRESVNLSNMEYIASTGSKEEMKVRLSLLDMECDEAIEKAKETGASISLITQKFEKQRTEIIASYAKIANDKLSEEYATKEIITRISMQNELNAVEIEYSKGKMSKEKYEKEKLRIAQDYAEKSAQLTIALLELELKAEGVSPEEKAKLELKLQEAKAVLAQLAAQKIVSSNKEVADSYDAIAVAVENVTGYLGEFAKLGSALYERKIQEVEGEQDANQKAYENDIARIEHQEEIGAITTEEAEARKRAAEDRTAVKEAELAKKKADIQTRQAKLEKASTIAQITLNTAAALIKLWASPGFPTAIPLAAMVSVLGAIQLATAIATPIPKYAKGTKDHKGGPAIVGDGGKHELVLTPSGQSFITPATSTLIEMPKGSIVLPDAFKIDDATIYGHDLLKILGSERGNDGQPIIINDFKLLQKTIEKEVGGLSSTMKAQMKQQRKLAYNNYHSNLIKPM